jgi:hypothetical protein
MMEMFTDSSGKQKEVKMDGTWPLIGVPIDDKI